MPRHPPLLPRITVRSAVDGAAEPRKALIGVLYDLSIDAAISFIVAVQAVALLLFIPLPELPATHHLANCDARI